MHRAHKAAGNYGPTGAVPSVGTKIQGGTAYFQEGPAAPPTYIFPFISSQVCSTMNYGQFTYMMYRPLYWFGNNNSPPVDHNYSIGNPPVFSNGDKTVTVTLKNWKWSNGEPVTSRDVEFWMNMDVRRGPKDDWCDYTPGYFPDNVASMSLSQRPDRGVPPERRRSTRPGSSTTSCPRSPRCRSRGTARRLPGRHRPPAPPNLPDTTPAGVAKVYNYLNTQATNVASYATSPLWSIVDGPWKLQSFTSTGEVTFVPNPDYSGSPKPTLSKFVEVPFTSDEAILNEIKSGGPSALSMAELPDEYLPQLKSIESEGYNAGQLHRLRHLVLPAQLGQPDLRPRLQPAVLPPGLPAPRRRARLVGQDPGRLRRPDLRAGSHGAVQPLVDSYERNNPYKFSVSDAANLLKSHGWSNVGSGEVATAPSRVLVLTSAALVCPRASSSSSTSSTRAVRSSRPRKWRTSSPRPARSGSTLS